MSISVLLADDHRIFRDGLRSLLSGEPGLEVVGDADDGIMAVTLACQLEPNVLVMDIAMPLLDGIGATRRVVAEAPGVGVLILSMHADARYIAEAFAAGALSYLVKDCAFGELVEGIRHVARGEHYVSVKARSALVEPYRTRSGAGDSWPEAPLTPRELEVLRLLSSGSSTKEAARILHISPKTVETHRHHLMEKVGIYSIAGLTRWAIRQRITPLAPTAHDDATGAG